MSAENPTLFLALDTSFERGSVGVFQRTDRSLKTLAFKQWTTGFCPEKQERISHGSTLIKEIVSTGKEAGKELCDLDFIGVSIGPGRFTGVRTAVNTARTLAFSLKMPCYPLNSLRVTAEEFLSRSRPPFVTAFNSFKKSVYFAKFTGSGKTLIPPRALPFPLCLEEMKNVTLCLGDLTRFYKVPETLKESCEFKIAYPSAKSLAKLIHRDFDPKNLISWDKVQPLYLREDVAKKANQHNPADSMYTGLI